MFFKSCKIITFSHLNSTNFNNNFKDNFMREKVNKKAPKAKTLHISALEPNWKWINDSLILSRKKHDAIPNFNQHWSTLININNAVIYVFHLFPFGSVLKLFFDDFFYITFGYTISL